MSDPRRPDGYDPNRPYWSQPTEQIPPADPAYGGYASYPSYVPPNAPDATRELPPYWTQTQYPQYPPPPPAAPPPPPPKPPKSPRWLWLVAGGAVTLVIGLVAALVIANGSDRDDTAVAPLPPMPEPSTTAPPTTTRTTTPRPTTTRPTTTAPTTEVPGTSEPGTEAPTTDAAATETVVYRVTGEGRAISITYVDTGGVLQMEFNVALPWTREVAMSRSTARAASVTVINVGREIGCSISVNGEQTEEHSGTGLTICSSIGG